MTFQLPLVNQNGEFIMNTYIKYDTTLKACGDEYKKIVFWNRFIRNPIELILTWLPALASIIFIAMGYIGNMFIMVIKMKLKRHSKI